MKDLDLSEAVCIQKSPSILQEYSCLIVLFLLALQRGNVFTVKCYHQLLFCESKLSHFQTDKNFY